MATNQWVVTSSEDVTGSVAELVLLVSIIADDSMLPFVAQFVFVEDFYVVAHQSIFRTMLALGNRRERVTVLTLDQEITKSKELGYANVIHHLMKFLELLPVFAVSRELVYDYIGIVRYRSQLRHLSCIFTMAADQCSQGINPLLLLERVQQSLTDCKENWQRPIQAQQEEQKRQLSDTVRGLQNIERGRYDA